MVTFWSTRLREIPAMKAVNPGTGPAGERESRDGHFLW